MQVPYLKEAFGVSHGWAALWEGVDADEDGLISLAEWKVRGVTWCGV